MVISFKMRLLVIIESCQISHFSSVWGGGGDPAPGVTCGYQGQVSLVSLQGWNEMMCPLSRGKLCFNSDVGNAGVDILESLFNNYFPQGSIKKMSMPIRQPSIMKMVMLQKM